MTLIEFEWLALAIMAVLISYALGDQRGRNRTKIRQQQLANRTDEATKRRWVENGIALEIFERAFSDHTGGCARQCDCGVQFYNPDNGWEFDPGELETYINDQKARSLEWSVGSIYFEGRYFVPDCSCWQERAKKIIGFLRHHDMQIAEYLSLEKKSLEDASKQVPVIH